MSAGAEDRYFLHFVGVAQEVTTRTDPTPPRHYLDPFVARCMSNVKLVNLEIPQHILSDIMN